MATRRSTGRTTGGGGASAAAGRARSSSASRGRAAPRAGTAPTLPPWLLSKHAQVSAMALVGAVTALWPALTVADPAVRAAVGASAAMSALAFFVTRAAVPVIARRTHAAGLHGLDINKKGTSG
jgi:hypothetical protein